ncbi:MAG: Nramp family divalent metal transporter [Thermoguttaceae bacterium]|jgi:manganese transport protein
MEPADRTNAGRTPPNDQLVSAAVEVLAGRTRRKGLARLWPFLGPAFVACVAYLDPGNFATNLEGGAKFGYTLVWVVVASNLMGMLIQALSAKLGIATGMNLAELCREHYPRWLTYTMWVLMEVVAMATDLAEFLGAALGFYLLLGIPLWIAGLLTAVATFVILGLERYGFRSLEGVITAMVGVVVVCYVIELGLARPSWGRVFFHAVVPQFRGAESVLLATGILGATVMPHVIFLHSALMQGRIVTRDPQQMKRLFRYEVIDVVIAMGLAGLVNAAMLVMAAKTFNERGLVHVDAIEKAYMTLQAVLGSAANTVFALSLLAAGLSSSAVGTMSGQVIMQGFLKYHIPIWLRRGLTMAPALVVIVAGWDPTRTLVLSQVVLSFGLPFAIVPLILFTRRKDLMGPLVNSRLATVSASAVAVLILSLNAFLLHQLLWGK